MWIFRLASISLERLGVFIKHVLYPFEIITEKHSSRLYHDASFLVEKSQLQKRVNCFIDSSLRHCASNLFDRWGAKMIIGGKATDLSNLVFGLGCKICEVVVVEIIFHRLWVSLILRINPQYFGQTLLYKLSIGVGIQIVVLQSGEVRRDARDEMIE